MADDSWPDLAQRYWKEGLTLVLGAGVSAGCKLPNWPDLLRRMAETCWPTPPGERPMFDGLREQGLSLPAIAAVLEAKWTTKARSADGELPLKKRSRPGERFAAAVREALYRDLPCLEDERPPTSAAREAWRKGVARFVRDQGPAANTLRAVAAFCVRREGESYLANPHVQAVVTLNLDSLMQRYMSARYRYLLRTTERPSAQARHHRPGYPTPQRLIPIYHMHGYLRFDWKWKDRKSGAPDVRVFTEQEYYDFFNNPNAVFNYTFLYLMREHPCLFVGLSLGDENLRRLLHYSYKERVDSHRREGDHRSTAERRSVRHFAILKRCSDGIDDLVERSLRRLGVRVAWVRDYAEIPDRLRAVYEAPPSRDRWDDVYDVVPERPVPFGPVPLEQALGKRLGHDLSAADGSRLLRKGRVLTPEDLAVLRARGRSVVYVAESAPGDIEEDAAALRLARALKGEGLAITEAAAGRVSLKAEATGILRADPVRIRRVNEIEGLALATLPGDSVVKANQMVATLKVIPFTLSEAAVRAGETAAAEGGPLLRLDRLPPRKVALLLSGAPTARDRVWRGFEGPLRARVEGLGSTLRAVEYVAVEEETGEAALADALRRQVETGAEVVILAGQTAIVDRHDLAPRAIERAGGAVVWFGAPVDPGNLLLVAEIGTIPVLGLPGCARSPERNVVDLVLPRVLAGERLDRGKIAALGHGGLCEDVVDRPMPRD